MKLQIIGGGKMGEALLGGVLATGWAEPSELACVELDDQRRAALADAYPGVSVVNEVVANADALIAVKPQYVDGVVAALGRAGVQRLLSVAAGIRVEAMNPRRRAVALFAACQTHQRSSVRGLRQSLGDL